MTPPFRGKRRKGPSPGTTIGMTVTPESDLPESLKTKRIRPGEEGWVDAPEANGDVPRAPIDETMDYDEIPDLPIPDPEDL